MEKTKLLEALLSTDRIAVRNCFLKDVDSVDAISIIEKLVVPVLDDIGDKWLTGEIALSQVYMSGRIIEEVIEEMLPAADSFSKEHPKMAIAVLNDYHLLGKRIVYSYVRSSGYSLLDFNRVTVSELVEKIVSESISVILISTLMLASALDIRKVKDKLIELGNPCKIIVGGAPFRFDANLYKEVGADATAASIVDLLEAINS